MEAVQRAINVMEDFAACLMPVKARCLPGHDGRNDLDASIMDGKTLAAGAVAGA
ncbi:isoaspartyl peptidase/L-asparaginase [Plesiomonas shigelloides subsp. oncorhynchi]|nr:isoaspartyl peptidase/L-asparaginase [Plesiomonas shigelloides]